jgi:rhodanese-related sulfurtransferase
MRTRYLVLDALAELARARDRAAGARLAEALSRDAEWPVRMHAAELAEGLPDAQPSLVAATRDREPRVREAALKSLSASPVPGAPDAAVAALASEGWPFVKVQALAVLARAPAARSVDDALRGVLRDQSARVRGGALVALGERRATSSRDAVRERLDDEHEDTDVRAAAAEALGAMCDARDAGRLTELAAVNVPLMHAGGGGMVPNPDFVRVMTAAFPKDAKIVVGCKAGGRSLRAVQMLSAAGFTETLDQRAGWDGARDPFGQLLEPGWSRAGLPVEQGQPSGRAWEDMQRKAG